eukprot:2846796-Prymnesium_polylepis.1
MFEAVGLAVDGPKEINEEGEEKDEQARAHQVASVVGLAALVLLPAREDSTIRIMWLSVAVCGCLWLSASVCVCLRLSAAVCGCLRLSAA